MEDGVSRKILAIIEKSNEPLETKEIESRISGTTRAKVLYRLNDLRGEGRIRGKLVGGGKGTWIWWA